MNVRMSAQKKSSRYAVDGLQMENQKSIFRNPSHTIAPWSSGKHLVWDATCPDTFAQSHRSLAVHFAGGIAAKAEDLKRVKYADFLSSHIFVPVAIETTRLFGIHTLSFMKSLGKRLS